MPQAEQSRAQANSPQRHCGGGRGEQLEPHPGALLLVLLTQTTCGVSQSGPRTPRPNTARGTTGLILTRSLVGLTTCASRLHRTRLRGHSAHPTGIKMSLAPPLRWNSQQHRISHFKVNSSMHSAFTEAVSSSRTFLSSQKENSYPQVVAPHSAQSLELPQLWQQIIYLPFLDTSQKWTQRLCVPCLASFTQCDVLTFLC